MADPTTPTNDTPAAPAAAPAPAADKGKNRAAPAAPAMSYVRAVHGVMVHPKTAVAFRTEAAVKVVVDGWISMQAKAGKLVIES